MPLLPPHFPVFAKISQVAGALSVQSGTVRRLIRDGKLPGHRIGAALRVSRAELERFLAANP